jgi:hypothetical protein
VTTPEDQGQRARELGQRAREWGYTQGRQDRRRHIPWTANPYRGTLIVTDECKAAGWDAGWDVEDRQLSEVSRA